jgi:hypothetical protein
MDDEYINAAYGAKSGIFVGDDTMYIAGTRTLTEWRDNLTMPLGPLGEFTGVPVGVTTFDRYKVAESHLSPNIVRVVGHSMGGTVALALAQEHNLVVKTYGAPVLGYSNVPSTRYRDTLDPISYLDLGAKDIKVCWPPHTAGRGC